MAYQIKCTNIVSYDKDAGKYVYCNEPISFDEDRVGQTVDCPNCGEPVVLLRPEPTEMPGQRDDLDKLLTLPIPDAAPTPQAPTQRSTRPQPTAPQTPAFNAPTSTKRPAAPNQASPATQTGQCFCPTCGVQLAPGANHCEFCDDGADVALTPAEEERSPESTTATSTTNLQTGTFCAHCGAQLRHGVELCDACGFHQKLRRRLVPAPGGSTSGSATSQGWIYGLWVQSETTPTVLVFSFVTIVMLLAVFAFALLLLLMLGAGAGVLCFFLFVFLFVAMIIVGAAILVNAVASKAEHRQATLLHQGIWSLMLPLSRLSGWRKPVWPFPQLKLLDLRHRPVTDDELLKIEQLTESEAIDLEGTQISDAGLIYFRGLDRLQRLVLKQTRTTAAAVQDLQRALPNVWIWH